MGVQTTATSKLDEKQREAREQRTVTASSNVAVEGDADPVNDRHCNGGQRSLQLLGNDSCNSRERQAGGNCGGRRQQMRRWMTVGKGSCKDGRWALPRQRVTAASTAGDGRLDGGQRPLGQLQGRMQELVVLW